jgi:L-seryl-tRNA(Ser) seleniumtransferase
MKSPLQVIPQVDKVLRHEAIQALHPNFSHEILAKLVRVEIEKLRLQINDQNSLTLDSVGFIANQVVKTAGRLKSEGLREVINGTGVILSTNLGRAPIGKAILEQALRCASSYTNLEYDLDSGTRGQRGSKVEELLCLLTGAQASLVVNNNAAALLLAINSLAADGEVIVSRSELIEIGGNFRLPNIITASGGKLCEVGTSNRTRIKDYKEALNEHSRLLLRCHRSNFSIEGFTEDPSIEELVSLAQESGIPFINDVGSGVIANLKNWGIANEPTVQEALQAGCDLVTFSGDKLLGGPQAGFIVGQSHLIKRLKQNPLYRALRVDKITLSCLEASLKCYLTHEPEEGIPILRMFKLSQKELQEKAELLVSELAPLLSNLNIKTRATNSKTGGGSLPTEIIPSYGIALKGSIAESKLSKLLRLGSTPVIATIDDSEVVIDLRTVFDDQLALLKECLIAADKQCSF